MVGIMSSLRKSLPRRPVAAAGRTAQRGWVPSGSECGPPACAPAARCTPPPRKIASTTAIFRMLSRKNAHNTRLAVPQLLEYGPAKRYKTHACKARTRHGYSRSLPLRYRDRFASAASPYPSAKPDVRMRFAKASCRLFRWLVVAHPVRVQHLAVAAQRAGGEERVLRGQHQVSGVYQQSGTRASMLHQVR
jgi:hypothetical protein